MRMLTKGHFQGGLKKPEVFIPIIGIDSLEITVIKGGWAISSAQNRENNLVYLYLSTNKMVLGDF